jgi:hypothetical protein
MPNVADYTITFLRFCRSHTTDTLTHSVIPAVAGVWYRPTLAAEPLGLAHTVATEYVLVLRFNGKTIKPKSDPDRYLKDS